MYRLYGIPTQNTFKCAYTLQAVGVDFEFQNIDLAKGEQKTESFLKINPIGKVPALKHNDFAIFESGAICRYVANVERSPLYPTEPQQRAQVDAWMDFFSSHLGRWLSTWFFEAVIKPGFGRGETNADKCKECLEFINQQIVPVEKQLKQNAFLTGTQPTIADFSAYAYMEQAPALKYDLSPYPAIQSWLAKMSELNAIKQAKAIVK